MKITNRFRNLLSFKQLPPPFGVMAFLLAAFLLQACEKESSGEPPYAATLNAYYIESTHLGVATEDSVYSFANKVLRMTEVWPEVKKEQQYKDLVDNIYKCFIVFRITADGKWDGVIEFTPENNH